MADLGTARGRIIVDSSGVRSGLAAGSGAMDIFSKKAIGLGLGLLGGYGIVKGIQDTVSASADFEQKLSNLRAVAGATGGQMEQLSDQALRLGKSTVFSASEVAGAQTELVKAGSTVEEVLGGALDAALALAAAGEVDLATSATVVSGALNAFGLAAADAGSVADILASTANSTATDVANLGVSFQQGAAAAKQAGLPIQDFTALLGALAEGNVIGSDAGTSLKAALLSLVAPIGRGKQAIQEYGLEFFKANGDVKGAVGIATELREKLGGLNREQRLGVLSAIAGRDGFRALAAAYDLGPAALARNIAASQEFGTAAETARIKQDNLRGDVEKLGGALETLQIQAGGALVGGLRGLTQGLTGLIDSASESEDLAAFGQGILALGQGAASAVGALAPLASAALQVAGAAGSVLASVAGLGGAFLGSAAGATALQVALIGLAAAYGVVKVAALAAAVSTRVAATAGTAGAFLSLAGGVRSAGGAMALLGAVAPKVAAGVGGLAGTATAGSFGFASLAAGAGTVALPLLGVAAAVGVVAGGVALLASGAFRGASAAEQLASSIGRVTAAAGTATGSLATLNGAIGGLKDANIAAATAALAVERAERNYDAAVRASGAGSLEAREAAVQLTAARRQSDLATQSVARAERTVSATALKGVTDIARLTTEIGRGTTTAEDNIAVSRRLGTAFGIPATAAKGLGRDLNTLDRQGGSASDKFNALRSSLRNAAASMDTTTARGKETSRILTTLGRTDNAGLVKFAGTLQSGLAAGLPKAQAVKEALASIKPPPSVNLKGKDEITPKAKAAKAATDKVKDKNIAIQANVSPALAGIGNVQAAINALKGKTVTVNVVKVDRKGSWNTQETIEHLEATPKRQKIETEFVSKGTDKLEKAVDPAKAKANADAIIAGRVALDARLEALDRKEDERQQARERRRLRNAVATAEKELKSAKPDERADARRSLADARAALSEFRITATVDAKRAAIGIRTGLIDGISSAASDMESALQDIGSRIGDAIDRGLQAKLKGIDEGLRATITRLDADLRGTLDAIASGPEAQRLAAIDADVTGSRAAREARDAGRQRGELTTTAGDAAALVKRRTETLARARTASEQQAAQALLTQALAQQVTAATALADFEQDQRLSALEREKAGLEASLQARRDAAQKARDEAAAAAEARAAADREAAEALAEQQKLQLDRDLRNLEGRFRQGLIKRKQFNRELAEIMGDPALAADLERSGRELGIAFTGGLARSVGGARDAARQFAKAIAEFLALRSPAKTGPLSEPATRWGLTLGRDMAAGLLRSRGDAERAAAGVAGALAQRAAFAGAVTAGVPSEGGGFTQHNTYNVDGPTIDVRELAARSAWERQNGGRR